MIADKVPGVAGVQTPAFVERAEQLSRIEKATAGCRRSSDSGLR